MSTSSNVSPTPNYRFWIPLTLIFASTAILNTLFLIEHHMRVILVYPTLILTALLVGLWWVFLAGRFRWKSLLAGIFGTALLIAFAATTLRYDGSANGALPASFTWKWTEKPGENLEALPVPAESPSLAQSRDPDLADFPSFLGAAMDGFVPDPGLNPDWETNPPEELWRIPIGLGWSAFSVVGERAVTQEQRGGDELVTCYHVQTGQLLWSHTDPARFSEAMGGDGPRATPTIRDGVVYVLGATGILNALHLSDGKLLWTRPVLEELGLANVEWGKSASPLVLENLVVVTGGENEANAVLAFDRETGKPVWQSGDGPASYSSPVLLNLDGKDQVVTILGDNVSGFDPETGDRLWRFDWPGGFPKVAQPIQVSPNQVLVAASYGTPTNLLQLTVGDPWTVESIWDASQMKTKFSSPIVVDGHAYGLDEGKLIAMDVATGKRVWKGAKYGYGQNLRVGDRYLLIQAETGDVALVQIDPEAFTELGRISPLTSKTWNAPALAGNYLLVRNDREAVCLKLP